MIQINGIKPLVEIPDNSIYFYYSLIFFITIATMSIIYFIYYFFKYQPISKQKQYYQMLQNVDFNNPKQTAYTISKYGQLLNKDERETRLFEELNQTLDEFKYKKTVTTSIPNSIKAKYDIFMETLHVK